ARPRPRAHWVRCRRQPHPLCPPRRDEMLPAAVTPRGYHRTPRVAIRRQMMWRRTTLSTLVALALSISLAGLGISSRPVGASANAAVGSGRSGDLYAVSADSAT